MAGSEPTESALTILDTRTTFIELANILIVQADQETKKDRTKRVAKEKMYASWNTFNNRSPSVRSISQVCKPRHYIHKR